MEFTAKVVAGQALRGKWVFDDPGPGHENGKGGPEDAVRRDSPKLYQFFDVPGDASRRIIRDPSTGDSWRIVHEGGGPPPAKKRHATHHSIMDYRHHAGECSRPVFVRSSVMLLWTVSFK